MGARYWVRVGIMLLALAGVLLTMRHLNQNGPSTRSPRSPSVVTITLCPTRVSKVVAGKLTIFEEGMGWYRQAESSERQSLDPVAIEQWFSRNCTFTANKANPSANVQEALKVYFVNGEVQTLLRSASASGNDEYEWMGQPFRSSQVAQALHELEEIPALTPSH